VTNFTRFSATFGGRQKIRRTLVAGALALGITATAAPAHAWTLIAGIPQPVTVFLHAMGGFAWAAWMDSRSVKPDAAIASITAIGFAKELMDVTFYVDDFIAWPVGAALYYQVKKSPHCFSPPPGELETDWYIPRPICIPKIKEQTK